MKKTSKIAIGIVIVAILLLGIGYAAISNITLNIGGIVTADPSQANFIVRFAGTPEVSDSTKVTAEINETDKTKATIDVEGLKTLGETVTATYEIENASENLSANLTIATTNSNTEYFEITSALAKTSLVAKDKTTVTVSVKLIKELVEESEEATVNVKIEAVPVQPGEEGKTGGENGTTTLSTVKNNHIGQYIDLGGTSYVGEATTADDWRIFYVDEEEQKVYAILADYLPAEYVPIEAGLTTNPSNYPYGVWSHVSESVLIDGFKHETAWDSLVSGIDGTEVTGGATKEILELSYKEKTGITIDYESNPTIIGDLYVPHYSENGDAYENSPGYWLSSDDGTFLWYVISNGNISSNFVGYKYAARPVVSLPFNTGVTVNGDLWTVTK